MAVDGNDILRCACKWRVQGVGDVVNVYDLRANLASGSVTDEEALEDVREWFAQVYGFSGFNAFYHQSVVHQEISVFNRSNMAPVGYVSRIPALDGEETGENGPFDKTCMVLFRTNISRKVGRKYLPMCAISNYVNGYWDSGYLAAVRDYADVVMTDVAGAALDSLRYVVTGVNVVPAVAPTSYTVRDLPARIGRRNPGRGS